MTTIDPVRDDLLQRVSAVLARHDLANDDPLEFLQDRHP